MNHPAAEYVCNTMTIKRSTISRRRALSGAATAGLGLPLLAACGDDGGGESAAADPSTPATSSAEPRKSGGPTKSASSSAPAGGGIPTADVPVGGGIVLTDQQVVITQPTDGDFHAFTAICTHAGCPVARVESEIQCDCHGSRFSIDDGSVVGGPAPEPLAPVEFTVTGDQITLA